MAICNKIGKFDFGGRTIVVTVSEMIESFVASEFLTSFFPSEFFKFLMKVSLVIYFQGGKYPAV